jgi:quinol-cytochrome oxidoreductase complex cytochrome b subunit
MFSFPIVKNTRVTGLRAQAHIDPSWVFTSFYHIQHKVLVKFIF